MPCSGVACDSGFYWATKLLKFLQTVAKESIKNVKRRRGAKK
jgi:hypothetical protein